jgi:hypothetical protein
VLFLLQRNRLKLAAIVCVAGLLAKEPVLFAAPIVLLLAVRSRARAAIAIILAGAPALYLVVHHTNWIANGAGREFPYFTESNLHSVISNQGGFLQAILIAVVVGFGPLAIAATLAWSSATGLVRVWAIAAHSVYAKHAHCGRLDSNAGLLCGGVRSARCSV